MPRFAAFLRAINVGGHIVKMERLRALFGELGYTDVQTFIASGNVIFDSPARSGARLEAKIEAHLRQALGYEVATFIRTPEEVAAVAKYQPFAAKDLNAAGVSLYVGFVRAPLDKAGQNKVLAFRTDVDDLHVAGREVYWLCRVRSMESDFSGAVFEKALGVPATFRNITSVRKFAAKIADA